MGPSALMKTLRRTQRMQCDGSKQYSSDLGEKVLAGRMRRRQMRRSWGGGVCKCEVRLRKGQNSFGVKR